MALNLFANVHSSPQRSSAALLPSDMQQDDYADSQPETQPFETQTQQVGSQDVAEPPPKRIPISEACFALLMPQCGSIRPRIELLRSYATVGFTVGRSKAAVNALLPERKVSGVHCKFWMQTMSGSEEERVWVQDLSSNGFYVDNVKVGNGKKRLLESGCEVSFGPPATNIEDDLRYIFTPTPRGSDYDVDHEAGGGLYRYYNIRDQIGKGSFATVKRAIDRATGEIKAVKVINKQKFIGNPKTFRMLEREVEIMKSIQHTHVVRYENYFEDETYMFLVMEYVDGGDLLDYAVSRGGLGEEQAAEIARQILLAVHYLHGAGVCHRDLKPDNVLLTRGDNPVIKVSDFGLAKAVDGMTFLKTACGTPTYLAPEVALQTHQQGYSFAVDAWSIGVIVYAILANTTPFIEDENMTLHEKMKVRKPDLDVLYEGGFSDIAIDFIRRLLIFNPRDRMTIVVEALAHPWLNAARMRQMSSGSVSLLPPNDVLPHGRRRVPAEISSLRTEDDDASTGSYSQRMNDIRISDQHPDHRLSPTASIRYSEDLDDADTRTQSVKPEEMIGYIHDNLAVNGSPFRAPELQAELSMPFAVVKAEPSLVLPDESAPSSSNGPAPSESTALGKRKEPASQFSSASGSESSLSSLDSPTATATVDTPLDVPVDGMELDSKEVESGGEVQGEEALEDVAPEEPPRRRSARHSATGSNTAPPDTVRKPPTAASRRRKSTGTAPEMVSSDAMTPVRRTGAARSGRTSGSTTVSMSGDNEGSARRTSARVRKQVKLS